MISYLFLGRKINTLKM